MSALIAAALRRPTGTCMVFLGVLILGAVAALNLRLELLPDLAIPRLTVSTSYPGLPASEVRSLLTIPLEDQLASVRGVRRVTSVSRDGLSVISLEFSWGEDMVSAAVKTRESIDVAYTALPSDAGKPQVLPAEAGERPLAIIGVRPRLGDLAFARRLAEREIKTRLQQVDGVGTVVLTGGAVDEVVVSVDQSLMASKGLTLKDVADVVARNNYDYPTGSIVQGGREYLVKATGAVTSPEGLGGFHFSGSRSALRLSDIAAISMDRRERVSFFQADGRESVGLSVIARRGASPIRVAQGVRDEVGRLQAAYGKDLDISIVSDGSVLIVAALRGLGFSILAGALIAFLVLIAFLRDVRTAGLLMLSLPLAITVTLTALQVLGRTLNVMSLGGCALGIGMIVDNSVVILENLQKRHIGRRATPDSVLQFTQEMASSRLGATLTLVVVFLPIIFLPGLLGALFTDLSLSVIFAQLSSFLTSITLMPVLFLLLEGRSEVRLPRTARTGADRRFRGGLLWTLRRPWTLAAVVTGLTAIGAACVPLLGFEFLPPQDTGEIEVTITMPYGADIERSASVTGDSSRLLLVIPGVQRVYARAGGEPGDARYYADPEERREIIHLHVVRDVASGRSPAQIAEAIRRGLVLDTASVDVGLPGSPIAPLLGLGRPGRAVVVSGVTQEEARSRGATVARMLGTAAAGTEASTARVSIQPEGERAELRLVPDRDAITVAGLSLADLAEIVRNAIMGSYPSHIVMEGRDLDVRVRVSRRQASRPEDLPGIVVGTPGGAESRLSELADIRSEAAIPALCRRDRADAVIVSVEPPAGSEAALAADIFSLERRFDWVRSLEGSVLAENVAALIAASVLVLVLLYLVLGGQFESFALPALLLAALPLAFSGIVIGLAVTGKPLGFDSTLGIIVLFGIAVNNSIILYETYSARRNAGVTIVGAVYQGTADRMRPIIITMLITVLSLLPVAMDVSRTSAESGMAVAIIGGLFVSTVLTLFVLPRLFIAYFKRRDRGVPDAGAGDGHAKAHASTGDGRGEPPLQGDASL